MEITYVYSRDTKNYFRFDVPEDDIPEGCLFPPLYLQKGKKPPKQITLKIRSQAEVPVDMVRQGRKIILRRKAA